MSGWMAEGRLQVLQIYRLLQCVREGDKEQIEKMVNLGVNNLINLTEPQHGTGVLHLAAVANNQGRGPVNSIVQSHLAASINLNIKDPSKDK